MSRPYPRSGSVDVPLSVPAVDGEGLSGLSLRPCRPTGTFRADRMFGGQKSLERPMDRGHKGPLRGPRGTDLVPLPGKTGGRRRDVNGSQKSSFFTYLLTSPSTGVRTVDDVRSGARNTDESPESIVVGGV